MRILHTSDWHLGKVLLERSLLEDQRHALAQITALLAAEPHDLLIVAGDIFDRSIPPEDAVTLLGDWLVGVREVAPGLPIVLIAGNHDSAARLAWSAGLLARGGVHIRGEAERVGEPVHLTTAAGEEAEVWPVPFLWPGALAEGEGPSTQVAALEAAVARVHTRQTPGVTQVLVAHCFTQGGRASDSERTFIGQATFVDPALFAGFDYVALGHLHRPQKVAENTHYSGSLGKYSFSEVDDDKGVLSVDVRAGVPPVVTPRRLRPLRQMRVLSGELPALLESPAYEPFRDDYVSITLTRPVHAGQPMATLRTRFPYLLQLQNPVIELVVGSGVPARERVAEANDVEADFLDFQSHIRGVAPPEDVVVAFRALHAAAAKGGGTGAGGAR
jgi:exonuclease SbcD